MSCALPPSLAIAGAALTDTGLVRDNNEDVVAYLPPDNAGTGTALALVADGMGGHAAGEVASRIAADMVRQVCRMEAAVPAAQRLGHCFAAANEAIRQRSLADPACTGMGTTCTVLVVEQGSAFLGHIGDSRAYLLRGSRLTQLSEDHSVVGELVRAGAITPDEAFYRPDRHLILRALGIDPVAAPQVWPVGLPIQAGDIFILCSDGLSDMIPDAEIAALAPGRDPKAACRVLMDAALAAGGHDNVSVAVVVIGPG